MTPVTVPFWIEAEAVGGRVQVAGQDVTHMVAATEVLVAPGQPTTLRLHMIGQGAIDAVGVVEVVRPSQGLAEAADLLEGLDPQMVWEAAMSDVSQDPAAAVISHLAEFLRGLA